MVWLFREKFVFELIKEQSLGIYPRKTAAKRLDGVTKAQGNENLVV